eukprot:1558849-Amphidinium_carterae.1
MSRTGPNEHPYTQELNSYFSRRISSRSTVRFQGFDRLCELLLERGSEVPKFYSLGRICAEGHGPKIARYSSCGMEVCFADP